MLNRFFGTNFHSSFHLFGISAFAVGLPTSKVILSLASMLMLLNLLMESNFKQYWKNIRSNRLLHILAAFWLLHLIALLWTDDFNYAFNDIRIKVTLLLIPLLLIAKPIQKGQQHLLIFGLFLSSLFVTSVYNYGCYNHWIGQHHYDDIRGLSLFGSHIRYGILIAMGAGISLYYFHQFKGLIKLLFICGFVWFSYYTYYSQIISGVVALAVVSVCYLLYVLFERSKRLGYFSLATTFLCIVLMAGFFITGSPKQQLDAKYTVLSAQALTASGRAYTPLFNADGTVNKKPIFVNVCEPELNQEWKKRSSYDINGLDDREQAIRFTILRYMTSKKLNKDSVGVSLLSNQDIRNIEQGIGSIQESGSGLMSRIDGIQFQLRHNENPNGHSLLQRIAYWKAGIEIIKTNWLLGVGTGDVQTEFNREYQRSHSQLLPENRLRAHNSYLTSWISFGILGIVSFLLMIFVYLKWQLNQGNLIGIMFILVAMSTFLIEDTLETQMGVSFFAFFYGLYATKKISSLS
jgi:hypothetical protein